MASMAVKAKGKSGHLEGGANVQRGRNGGENIWSPELPVDHAQAIEHYEDRDMRNTAVSHSVGA